MYCPNCSHELEHGSRFCSQCGTVVQPPMEQNSAVVSSPDKKKRKKTALIIALTSVLLLCLIGVILFFVLNGQNKVSPPELQGVVATPTRNSSYDKLKLDYDAGNIDLNTYFTQLVYCEYASSRMDEKYWPDEGVYSGSHRQEILKLIEQHYNQLDPQVIRFFLENYTMYNVILGDAPEEELQSDIDNRNSYHVQLLSNSLNIEGADKHYLDNAYLSKNGNFIIWYTNIGEDAISDELAREIASTLEYGVTEYEKLVNIDFSYTPSMQDTIFTEDYDSALEILERNNIPASALQKAMNVYIYNYESDDPTDNPLAFYERIVGPEWVNNLFASLIGTDCDGFHAYPIIVINRQKTIDNLDSLKSIVLHELFHHFQWLFNSSTIGYEPNPDDDRYRDAMANAASAMIYESSRSTGFLNDHAGVYAVCSHTALSTMPGDGYSAFPYFYTYMQEVDDWLPTLLHAHNETDPFAYIQHNTANEDLYKVSHQLAYCTIAKDFDHNGLYSPRDVTVRDVINRIEKISNAVDPGAILYYEIKGDVVLAANSENPDIVGMSLYGYRNGSFKELASSGDKLEVDLTYYKKYERFYLAVFNANLVESGRFTFETTQSEFAENQEFITTFDNYDIEIHMDMSIAGISTSSVSVGVVDESHQKEYLETVTTVGGMTLDSYTYHDFYAGCTYMTQILEFDGWYKEASTSRTLDLGVMLEKLNSMEDVTEIEEGHFRVKLGRKEMKELMSTVNTGVIAMKGNIYIDVYTEDGYITKMEYDFSDIMRGFDVFTANISFSNYNEAGDVAIPQSVIDNATDEIMPSLNGFDSLIDMLEDNKSFFDQFAAIGE